MNPHKMLAIRALRHMLARSYTDKLRKELKGRNMNEQYAHSGKTCAEVLAAYIRKDDEIIEAIDWIKSL